MNGKRWGKSKVSRVPGMRDIMNSQHMGWVTVTRGVVQTNQIAEVGQDVGNGQLKSGAAKSAIARHPTVQLG